MSSASDPQLPADEPPATPPDAYGGHARVYDDLYASRGKDYAAESRTIAKLIRDANPGAKTLLDVGCGTGSHLAHLRHMFDEVTGVEPSEAMRTVARQRLTGVAIVDADMRTLDLRRRFDAVICMFASIGYVGGATGDIAGLFAAVDAMAAHVDTGGVIVVEPWMTAARYNVGHIGSDFTNRPGSDGNDRTIFRMSHSGFDPEHPRVSVVTMHYLVGTPDGIEHTTDVHYMSMWDDDDFVDAFDAAGCTAKFYLPGFGNGVYVAVKR
jgi:SAM-dependent methyltransferase